MPDIPIPYDKNREKSETSAESILDWISRQYNQVVDQQEIYDTPDNQESIELQCILRERRTLGFIIHEIRRRIAAEQEKKKRAFGDSPQ